MATGGGSYSDYRTSTPIGAPNPRRSDSGLETGPRDDTTSTLTGKFLSDLELKLDRARDDMTPGRPSPARKPTDSWAQFMADVRARDGGAMPDRSGRKQRSSPSRPGASGLDRLSAALDSGDDDGPTDEGSRNRTVTAIRLQDLPRFGGRRSESYERFIRLFEGRMVLYSVVKSRWVANLLAALQGEAHDFLFGKLSTGEVDSWQEATACLRDRYKPGYLEKATLYNERQGPSESAESYGDRIYSHPALAGADQEQLTFAFIQGLRPAIRSAIALHSPRTFREAVDLAVTTEALQGSQGTRSERHQVNVVSDQINKALQPVKAQLKEVKTEQDRDSWRNQRPATANRGRGGATRGRGSDPPRGRRQVRCWKCDGEGHLIANCPEWKKDYANNRGVYRADRTRTDWRRDRGRANNNYRRNGPASLNA